MATIAAMQPSPSTPTPTSFAADPPLSAARLAGHLHAIEHGLLERGSAVRLMLLAALAGEHVLLIGPPGTAKSELARRLHRAFDSARYFERLLTRFSTPEELFGPLSLKALEDDRYERLIDGYLPTAGIAFLDEVFKANSAILNALLTLLNEREFDNGSARLRTPLISVVGASNEAPVDESLLAFHDRFLLRIPVAPVGDTAFTALLLLDDGQPPPAAPPPISPAERAAVLRARDAVRLGDDALAALAALRRLAAETVQPVSDRRWRQLVALMRCAAATEGRDRIDVVDLWLAPYVVAQDEPARQRLSEWFTADLLQAAPLPLEWLGRAVQAFEQQLDIERQLPADGAAADGPAQREADGSAGKIAVARALGAQQPPAGLARIVSPTLVARQRRRFSPHHLAARLAQVDELAGRVDGARADIAGRQAALAARLEGRFWLPPALVERWLDGQGRTLATLQTYAERLQHCRAGFADLPSDPALPAQVPVPVRLD